MSLDSYISKIEDENGAFEGSVTQAGRAGWILLRGVSHEIRGQRDAASGLATGKRIHAPYRVIKELDKSSPRFYEILTTNRNIPSIVMDFFTPQVAHDRRSGKGSEVNHWRVSLEDATVCRIDFRMANNRIGDNAKLPEFEEIEFVYRKITWEWLPDNQMAHDDWEAPVA